MPWQIVDPVWCCVWKNQGQWGLTRRIVILGIYNALCIPWIEECEWAYKARMLCRYWAEIILKSEERVIERKSVKKWEVFLCVLLFINKIVLPIHSPSVWAGGEEGHFRAQGLSFCRCFYPAVSLGEQSIAGNIGEKLDFSARSTWAGDGPLDGVVYAYYGQDRQNGNRRLHVRERVFDEEFPIGIDQ